MDDSQLLYILTMIQEQLSLPPQRLEALAKVMRSSPQRGQEIMDLFNDLNGSRYLGGEDRFLSLITNLVID